MSEQQPDALRTIGATAQAVVDHLIYLASGAESNEWLAQYLAIQKALTEGRFKDAVREESKLVDYRIRPKWVTSRELAKRITSAIGNLARELKLPNRGRVEIRLDDLPTTIDELGTIAEEEQRLMDAFAKSFKQDPLEGDPRYTQILAAASCQAESELTYHPMHGGFGFCHVFWEKKKAILRQVYGLEWRTPAELNPNITFD